jgi:predicted alpha/beta-fold hydrolase
VRNLREFDNLITAPLHGYLNAEDYWKRAASKPLLIHIQTPTLILNAKNDPFLPAQALPDKNQVSTFVHLDFPDHGGHVGFRGKNHGEDTWMPERVFQFFRDLK